MTSSKPRFKRQESWRYKRVKEAWRRPRGVTSRMRKEKAGWPPKVKVGRGTSRSSRGLHPRGLVERLVKHASDLEGLDPKKYLVRLSSRLGERKRLALLDKARQLNLRIANPGKEEAQPVEEAEEKTRAGEEVQEQVLPTEQVEESGEQTAGVVEITQPGTQESQDTKTGDVATEDGSP